MASAKVEFFLDSGRHLTSTIDVRNFHVYTSYIHRMTSFGCPKNIDHNLQSAPSGEKASLTGQRIRLVGAGGSHHAFFRLKNLFMSMYYLVYAFQLAKKYVPGNIAPKMSLYFRNS